jgi:anthranilate synthase/aminodeoxychorismate synthase-like glutamine amidotransferase
VVPSHEVTAPDVERMRPRAIVISPGPCTPTEAGCSVAVVERLRGRVPVLGVCLGHQAIATAAGGRVVRGTPMHGRATAVHHDGINLFAGIPSPMTAARYHSLVVEAASLPAGMLVVARDAAGTVMAIADERHGLYGVQFHPESILTRFGYRLLANFLERAGLPPPAAVVTALDEATRREAEPDEPPADERVVTF